MSIDQYIIKEKLKEKGQYISYRAIESESNSGVILKKFISSYPTAQAIGKLRSEFAILNKFDHPGIINAISLEPSDNSLMLVLEELEGEMLHDYISEKVELAEFFKISIAIVEAIKILHSKKILHKNINSYTINVSPEKVTLSGFDYAEKQGREYQYSNVKEAFEIGLSYISPEQTGRMNRTIDHRSDLYSLGIVLYELITNRLPFISTDPIELIHCHIAVPPIAPYEVDDSIPPIISDIIIKLLSKDTGDRYQSTRGLLHDLKRCQEFYRNNNELESFTLGEKDISDQFYIPGKLYGRSSELEQLTQSYLRAKEGRAEASFVAGYSGIGKSRLVRELQKLIDQDKGFFIKGKFDQFKQNGPLSSLFSAFSNLIDQLLSESEEKIEMWQNKVTAALGNTGQIIIDAVPEVELLIGPQPSLPELPIAEAENRYNQAINNFVKVFTDKEHPLCIFLDDMQWIDPATRQWIETQLSDTNLNHFYFIGAFRDNEVSPSHPLILMIDRIEKLDLSVDKIFLDPLEQKNIEQLLGDTLYVKPEHCSDLARELYKKTNGNPFFIRQAMLSLYEKKAIYFSQEHQKWTYDLEKVSKAKISDNVIELLTDLLHRLPIEILNTLKNASCIGSKFDIHVLSHISGYTKEQINIHLEDADKEGLLVPILSRGIDYPQDYAFQHDKIQQAALSLLSSAEKQNIQLKIGRFLLQESEDLSADDKIYEIANHFNAALDLITEEEEFKKIVEVNLLASKRAKNATAYDSALNYIVQAMNLVPQNTWEHPSDLTKELFLQRAESEHLSGNDENAPYFFDKAIDHANSVLD